MCQLDKVLVKLINKANTIVVWALSCISVLHDNIMNFNFLPSNFFIDSTRSFQEGRNELQQACYENVFLSQSCTSCYKREKSCSLDQSSLCALCSIRFPFSALQRELIEINPKISQFWPHFDFIISKLQRK